MDRFNLGSDLVIEEINIIQVQDLVVVSKIGVIGTRLRTGFDNLEESYPYAFKISGMRSTPLGHQEGKARRAMDTRNQLSS